MEKRNHDIHLSIQKAKDLFYNSAIPLSCRRLLHPDVEEFIIHEAEKTKPYADLTILVQITDNEPINANEMIALIHTHFKNKTEQAHHEINKIQKQGWRSLLIGFAFLIVMFLLTKALVNVFPENTLVITFRELLIILAWVALWRPAELLLYEWRPFKRKAKLFECLARCQIQLRVSGNATP